MIPGTLNFVPLRRSDAEAVLSWRYPAPYDFYNDPEGPTEERIAAVLACGSQYLAVLDQSGTLIGFRTFGAAAQVAGGDYAQEALDIGGGLRPDMMARGLGRRVAAAAMQFGVEHFSPQVFRTTLPRFNERAISICSSLGFRRWSGFQRDSDGMGFDIMMAPAPARLASQADSYFTATPFPFDLGAGRAG